MLRRATPPHDEFARPIITPCGEGRVMTYPNPGDTQPGSPSTSPPTPAPRAADYFVGFAARHATGRSR